MAHNSPLMSLPRELRDMISEFVILDSQPIGLKKRSLNESPHGSPRQSWFTTTSSLTLACQQMHTEFPEILCKTALSANSPEAIINVPVTDLDFSELIAFAEDLSPAEVETLNACSKIHVTLIITQPKVKQLAALIDEALPAWLGCCAETGLAAVFAVDDARSGRAPTNRYEVIALTVHFEFHAREIVSLSVVKQQREAFNWAVLDWVGRGRGEELRQADARLHEAEAKVRQDEEELLQVNAALERTYAQLRELEEVSD